MSAFTEAQIPDMSAFNDQQEHWLSNFVLNSTLRINITAPDRQYIFNYLRRAEAAFRQYELARKATLDFLEGSSQSVSKYMMAIFHWEVFLSQAWQAYELLRYMLDVDVFKNGDGSVEQRLNMAYNQCKHVESEIKSGNLLSEDATLSVYLTNEGLESNDSIIYFDEMADTLKNLGRFADLLQDPASIQAKIPSSSAGPSSLADSDTTSS